jgi:hypothetical protein
VRGKDIQRRTSDSAHTHDVAEHREIAFPAVVVNFFSEDFDLDIIYK